MPSRVLAPSTCPPQGPFPPAALFVATIPGYDPLGRPLRTTRFHPRLIRVALPRRRRPRRASRVPFLSLYACCAPYPAETCRMISGLRHGRRGLRRDVTGSALGL